MRLRYRLLVAIAAALLGTGWSLGTTTAHASTMSIHGTMSQSHSPGGPDKGSWGGHWDSHRDSHGGDCCRDHHDEFRHDHHECCHDEHFHDHCCDEHNGDNSSDCDWLRDHDHDRWWRDCPH